MSKKYGINNTELEFDEIYYVNPVSGNDLYDGIAPASAFKTILRYAQVATQESSACILSEGTHEIGLLCTILLAQPGCKQTVIGQGVKTRILLTVTYSSVGANYAVTRSKPFRFIRLTMGFKDGVASRFGMTTYATAVTCLEFSNVAFFYNSSGSPTDGVFITGNTTSGNNNADDQITFRNCTTTIKMLLQTFAYGKRYNCVETVSNTLGVKNNCLILNASDIDSVYNINKTLELWINAGDGKNWDGTAAHIGVYGGEYAWDWPYPITIGGEDEMIGQYSQPPEIVYQVSDNGNFPVTVTEKLNDIPIRQIYNAVRKQNYTVSPEGKDFWQLDNKESYLTIEASNRIYSTARVYTFSRYIEKIDVETTPVETTHQMKRIKVLLIYDAPFENVTLLVTNNALDKEPVWDMAQPGESHVFTNRNESNGVYAVSVRVIIERGDLERVTLSEIKYAYE